MAEAKKVYRVNKKNGVTYIYIDEPYWDKEKKSPRHKTECIGKLAEDGVTEIYNKRYLEKLEQQKRDEELLLIASTELIGEKLIIEHVIEKTGLRDNLLKVFTSTDTDKYLTLASYLLCTERPLSYSQEWADLRGYDIDISNESITELFVRTKDDLVNAFFHKWIIFNKAKKTSLFDITSVSSYDKNNEYIERGVDRECENLNKINISLLTTCDDTIPLWYKTLPVSISDINELEIVLDALKGIGVIDCSIIGDKNFFCDTNIKYLDNNGFKYILPLRKDIDCFYEEIKKTVPSIRYEGEVIHQDKDSNIIYGITKEITHEKYGKVFLYIYFDATKRESDLARFNIKLRRLHEQYKQKNGVTSKKDIAFCEKYFELHETDDVRTVEMNFKALQEYENSCSGICSIVTNFEDTPTNFYKYYRLRNEVELHFNDLKNTIDCKRLAIYMPDVMKGRVFINFLSLILINEIKNEVSHMSLEKIQNLTWKELLNVCKTYSITHFEGENNKKAYSIPSAFQKTIFEEFEIDYEKGK